MPSENGKPESLTHTGQTTSETTQSRINQKNLVESNYYAQSLFAQPYENGFQFISMNKGLTHKTPSFETPLMDEVDKHSTINFDAEEELFEAEEVDTLE